MLIRIVGLYVSGVLLPGMRHEIHNEEEKEKVFRELDTFINFQLQKKNK